MKEKTLEVQGKTVKLKTQDEVDWVNLTDLAKQYGGGQPGAKIRSWLKNFQTLEFLEAYETVHNADFKGDQMVTFKNDVQKSVGNLGIKDFIARTNAKGVKSKSGRAGGTWAVFDIAVNFMLWLSPMFQVFFIKDYKRMKSEELKSLKNKEKKYLRWVLDKIEDDALEANRLALELKKKLELED